MPSASTPQVEFARVSKSYDGRTPVVRNLDLRVQRGEFLTLLGPSGSGKSTCLMMLAGFETPDSGAIHIGGRNIGQLPPRKRGIGLVFQNYALFPHMTVAANLAFPLAARGCKGAEQQARIKRALQLVRLEGLEARRPAQLSGGQQQRVAIARALVFEPQLVLMDEPLGALDRRLRETMQYEIRRVQRTLGVTLIYVTHDQHEAMVMSDRIAVLRRGRVEQLAAPKVLYEEPQSAFVARFIGDSNRLNGRITKIEGQYCEVQSEGALLRARRITKAEVGAATTLAIRPERVVLQPPAGRYPNEFPAKVEEVTFVGDHSRLRLNTCGRTDFIAKTIDRRADLTGETIRIAWRPVDCRAL